MRALSAMPPPGRVQHDISASISTVLRSPCTRTFTSSALLPPSVCAREAPTPTPARNIAGVLVTIHSKGPLAEEKYSSVNRIEKHHPCVRTAQAIHQSALKLGIPEPFIGQQNSLSRGRFSLIFPPSYSCISLPAKLPLFCPHAGCWSKMCSLLSWLLEQPARMSMLGIVP